MTGTGSPAGIVTLFLLFRRRAAFQRLPSKWVAAGSALLVIASSVYELATTPSEAQTRRLLYVGLLGAMGVVILYALRQRADGHRLR